MSNIPTGREKAVLVEAMFDRIAGRYDLMNDVMTFGSHRRWKAAVLRALLANRPATILDVATGTGDLALAAAHALPGARVVGLDFSASMLQQARVRQDRAARAATHSERLLFVRGDALRLPLPDRSYEAACSAFALRNVSDLGEMFRELARVLTPGGKVALLDLVPIPNPPLVTRLAQVHLQRVVPRLGGLLAGDPAAYRYLPSSVETIPPLPRIEALLREAGFERVRHRLYGAGTTALIIGTRR